MSHKDILDSAQQEGPVPKGIGLKVMEGPRDGDLVGGYRVGAWGSINKLVGDND